MSRKKKNAAIEEEVYVKPLLKRRKPNRSIGGDIALYIFLVLVASWRSRSFMRSVRH